MKKTLRVLALALCLLMLSSCGLAEITDSVISGIGVYPIAKEKVTLTLGINSNSTVIDYDTNYFTNQMREVSGIDLQIVQFPEVDAETKLMLMVNGGTELPDILAFGTSATMRDQMADAGVLVPLDEYFDKETGIADLFYAACEREGVDADYILNLTRSSDGHIYGLPNYGEGALPNMYSLRAFINQKWLDALNLKAPTTIDELTEVLIAFRDGDPNGNGIKDEIPMTGSSANDLSASASALCWLQNLFIYRDRSDNLFLPLDQTDGKLDVSYDKEEYREYLKYVNMLVKEGLLDQAAFTQTTNEMRVQLKADVETVGMMFGSANGFGDNLASWQPLEQPTGFYGEKIVSVSKPAPAVRLMITTYCEHPELAFLFGCMGYDDPTTELATVGRYGEKGVNWRPAEEGEISLFSDLGLPPRLLVTENCWGSENNQNWGNVILPVVTGPQSAGVEVFDGNEVYGERLHARSVSMNKQYAPAMENLVGDIIYTEEEANEWAEARATLQSYLVETSALFAVGQMDPNSDEEWNNYLQELNNLQYKELLAVDQIAYNRTYGITE